MTIDLNADLGEGCDNDEALLALVSSANIACGGHAGDADTMRACARWAVAKGVSIGAHPSFADRANFGRTEMAQIPTDLRESLLEQLQTLRGIVHEEGGKIVHVKPHGALYNQAARDPELARLVVSTIREFDPNVVIVGLAGGALVAAAREAGMRTTEEAFADRGYQSNGALVPRGTPGALIEDEDTMITRILDMIVNRRVQSIDGQWCDLNAETLCLHGDGAHAVAFAQRIRKALDAQQIKVAA
ncbi:5-oxoprolinase subunit PxpA [Robbsia sp. KACC 23696]|uniref:5-oxoprolinase subunit PxpA n=1 Tax=Robbsia sp. KACC 23696 TaxID=3149231 RepID=UPI00325C256A